MLPLVGIEPKASDFHALHATVWANSPFARCLRPLVSHIATLYSFQKILKVQESIERDHIKDLNCWD